MFRWTLKLLFVVFATTLSAIVLSCGWQWHERCQSGLQAILKAAQKDSEVNAHLGSPLKIDRVLNRSYDIFTLGGGMGDFTVVLIGPKGEGVLHVREFDDIGVWKTREWDFQQSRLLSGMTNNLDPFTQKDSQTIEFNVEVPAHGEKDVAYTATYTW